MRLTSLGITLFFILFAQVAVSAQEILFDSDHQRLTVQIDSISPAELLQRLAQKTGIEIVAPPLASTPVQIGFSGRKLEGGLRFIARSLGYNHILYYSGNRAASETPQRLVLVAASSGEFPRATFRSIATPSTAPARFEAAEADPDPPIVAKMSEEAISRQQDFRNRREQKRYARSLAQAERFKAQPERYLRQIERLERKFPEQFSLSKPLKE